VENELIVQVTKEGINTKKGLRLAPTFPCRGNFSYDALDEHCGVSHKIEDVEERQGFARFLRNVKPRQNRALLYGLPDRVVEKRHTKTDLRLS